MRKSRWRRASAAARTVGRRRRVHGPHQRAERHRRDDGRARRGAGGRRRRPRTTTARASPPACSTATTRRSHAARSVPRATTWSRHVSHIIPGPNFGYWNSSMSDVMSRLVAPGQQRVDDGLAEREVLDALGRPVGLDLVGRHAPHLLGVGLEEDAVEAPAEARRRPALERGLVLRRPDPRPEVGADAPAPPRPGRGCAARSRPAAGSRRTCRRSRCGSSGAAAGSRPSGRISCQSASTSGTLVKKRWPPMSKRQPSRSTVRLMPPTMSSASSDGGVDDAGAAQLVGRREPRRAGTDDDDLVVSHGGPGHRKRTSPLRSRVALALRPPRRPPPAARATNARRWAGSKAVDPAEPRRRAGVDDPAPRRTAPTSASPPTAPPVRSEPAAGASEPTRRWPPRPARRGERVEHQRRCTSAADDGGHGDGRGPRQRRRPGHRSGRPARAGAGRRIGPTAPRAASGRRRPPNDDQHDAGDAGHGRHERGRDPPTAAAVHDSEIRIVVAAAAGVDEPAVGAAVDGRERPEVVPVDGGVPAVVEALAEHEPERPAPRR